MAGRESSVTDGKRATIALSLHALPRMRYLVCLVVGLLAGAILASMALNTMTRRNAWPRGLMNVMQHEFNVARRAARDGSCQQDPTGNAADHLRLIAGDLERALLPAGSKDPEFTKHADDLRAALAAWDVKAPCNLQTGALSTVNRSCDACHRDYR